MFETIFKRALITALVTVAIDFCFHVIFTRPMESLTYFVIKFLLAFFVATAMFSWSRFINQTQQRKLIVPISALIFSTLMSTYYRAWELVEAGVPFGSRAPDIIGIARENLLAFSGTWWIAHASFFVLGAVLALKLFKSK